MKTSEYNKASQNSGIKGLIIPIVLLILGILLVFGSDLIIKRKNAENSDKMEARIASMIDDLEGVSDSKVILLTDDDGNVTGAAVICSGGELSQNKKNIIDMITSLFGVGASDVFVGGR